MKHGRGARDGVIGWLSVVRCLLWADCYLLDVHV